jgi:hypothetical protein
MIRLRGVPVPSSRAVRTLAGAPAISGASAVSRGFRPAWLLTATTRDRGRLRFIATIRQEVLRLNDPSHARRFLWRVRMQPERFGPTTPKLGTRAGVRLAAIGKGVRIASLPRRIP